MLFFFEPPEEDEDDVDLEDAAGAGGAAEGLGSLLLDLLSVGAGSVLNEKKRLT